MENMLNGGVGGHTGRGGEHRVQRWKAPRTKGAPGSLQEC